MNQIIPFKKEIIFKSNIFKVVDISLTHDYKIKDDLIEGEFYLSGEYKITEASVINEEFFYNIPFSISISNDIMKETISLTLDNFDYKINKDVMNLTMELSMECEKYEVKKEKENEEEKEDEIEDILNEISVKNTVDSFEEKKEETYNENSNNVNMIDTIKDNLSKNNIYQTYKVYIVRESDTLENIALKYNVSLNDILEYNIIDELKIGQKIVIPYKNE